LIGYFYFFFGIKPVHVQIHRQQLVLAFSRHSNGFAVCRQSLANRHFGAQEFILSSPVAGAW
jgi:hypothetical protein